MKELTELKQLKQEDRHLLMMKKLLPLMEVAVDLFAGGYSVF
jgi:hypothetical protein